MSERSTGLVRIHQALYGYESGHKLLSASRELTSAERYSLLFFTDRSSDLADMPQKGYLTGLPVPEDSVYALIRTWPAPEMERPGSVWSHVLLIDVHDLAQIDDLVALNDLFRRPAHDDIIERSLPPSSIEPIAHRQRSWPMDLIRNAEVLMRRLYSDGTRPAFLNADEVIESDKLILSVWSQQWPRLRRGFRFCTYTQKDRSNSKHRFDMQIGPDKKWRKREPLEPGQSTREPYNNSPNVDWLAVAFDDLCGRAQGLRSFLKKTASDIPDGRRHFRLLCELYQAFEDRSPRDLSWAIQTGLQHFGEKEASLLKRAVVSYGLAGISQVSPDAVDLLIDNLALADEETIAEASVPLGVRLWRRDPGAFATLPRKSVLWSCISDIVEAVGDHAAIEGMVRHDELIPDILTRAPHLFSSAVLWGSPVAAEAMAIMRERDNGQILSRAVPAICQADRLQLANDLIKAFSADAVADALLGSAPALETQVGARLAIELCRCVHDPSEWFLGILNATGGVLDKTLLADLAEELGPDTPQIVTNSTATDPWALAWRKSKGELDDVRRNRMVLFLFIRGMKASGEAAATLIRYALDHLVEAHVGRDMSYAEQRALRCVLVSPDWFDFWTDRERVFRSVAKKAKREHFSLANFLMLSTQPNTIGEIAHYLSLKPSGRTYLSNVLAGAQSYEGGEPDKLRAMRAAIDWSA